MDHPTIDPKGRHLYMDPYMDPYPTIDIFRGMLVSFPGNIWVLNQK